MKFELTPLNIHAWLLGEIGVCGCAELESVVTAIHRHLEWCGTPHHNRPSYRGFSPNEPGVFYLMDAILDKAGLVEHGGSSRDAWLTRDGEEMLAALRKFSGAELAGASGVAYDGIAYGVFEDPPKMDGDTPLTGGLQSVGE